MTTRVAVAFAVACTLGESLLLNTIQHDNNDNGSTSPGTGTLMEQAVNETTSSDTLMEQAVNETTSPGTSMEHAVHCKDHPSTEFGDGDWMLQIDGRDAAGGRNAYGPSFEKALCGLDFALQKYGNVSLDFIMLEEIMKKAGMRELSWRHNASHGLSNFGPTCFKGMSCEAKRELLKDIPAMYVERESSPKCSVDTLWPMRMNHTYLKENFTEMLERYNRKIRGGSPDDKIKTLAKFLRNLAWLHPLASGNGRLRTIILQHEIRRLGLGKGAIMYNYNRDLYFINTSTYAAKIKEGIDLAETFFTPAGRKLNPWLRSQNVESHTKHFPPPSTTCDEGFITGSSHGVHDD